MTHQRCRLDGLELSEDMEMREEISGFQGNCIWKHKLGD